MMQLIVRKSYEQEILPVSVEYSEDRMPDIFVSTCGIFKSLGNFSFHNVNRGYVLHVISHGKGRMVRDGEPCHVKQGESFTFFPGQAIDYADEPRTPWRYYYIAFEGKRVEEALALAGITASHQHTRISRFEALLECIQRVSTHYREGGYSMLYPIKAAYDILSWLDESETPAALTLAHRLKRIIENQYGQINVESCAQALHVDRSTLYRLFKQEFGVSPKEFIDRTRLDKACLLLRETTLRIQEIASACGFSDPSYFIRAFKKHTGKPPQMFRQTLRP